MNTVGRRVLLGGGAALGLGALAACAPGPRDVAATSSAAGEVAAGSSPPSPTASAAPLPTATPAPSPVAPTAVEAPRLAERLADYLSARSGRLGLEVVDLERSQSFRHEAAEAECYSTIKVLVLMTLLRQGQEAETDLTEKERSLARAMITRSDNGATETLLSRVGRDEVQRVADLVGMDRTEIDDGWWGFWRTVPGDLNRMVGALVSGDEVLDGGRRATARFLMAEVVEQQRWGVFAPEAGGVHVAGKNGWGPLAGRYHANSTGWVSGEGRSYLISVLSSSTAGFRYARRTVSDVVDLCHETLGDGLA